MAGTFSHDEIQELLGAMSNEEHDISLDVHHHNNNMSTSTSTRTSSSTVEAAKSNTSTNASASSSTAQDEGEDEDNHHQRSRRSSLTLSVTPTTPSDEVDEEARAQARSERKRSREKQRRSDVNKQFADLTSLLRQIEIEEAEDDHTAARMAFSATNRVDLISRTIIHLERLREAHKRNKIQIQSLQQQLEQSQKAGEETAAKLKEVMFNQPPQTKQVMMMVPMMVNADGTPSFTVPGAQATGMHMPMISPYMMPQPYMAPPVPAMACAPTNLNNNHNHMDPQKPQPQLQLTQQHACAPTAFGQQTLSQAPETPQAPSQQPQHHHQQHHQPHETQAIAHQAHASVAMNNAPMMQPVNYAAPSPAYFLPQPAVGTQVATAASAAPVNPVPVHPCPSTGPMTDHHSHQALPHSTSPMPTHLDHHDAVPQSLSDTPPSAAAPSPAVSHHSPSSSSGGAHATTTSSESKTGSQAANASNYAHAA